MASTQIDAAAYQRQVDAHFDARSQYWRDLYDEETLWGVIHRERRLRALQWVDELSLPQGARILEAGCGAGLLSLDLVQRGFIVDAFDASEVMVDLARTQAAQAGVSDRLTVSVADAHALPFASDTYDLLIALGVLPFLHSPAVALGEMARVVRPGGYVLLTSDNLYRLNHLADPRFTPVLAPAKRAARRVLTRIGRSGSGIASGMLSYRSLQRLFSQARISIVSCTPLGFGPFTMLGKRVFPERVGIGLHRRLQEASDHGVAPLRWTGAQHIVLGRKGTE